MKTTMIDTNHCNHLKLVAKNRGYCSSPEEGGVKVSSLLIQWKVYQTKHYTLVMSRDQDLYLLLRVLCSAFSARCVYISSADVSYSSMYLSWNEIQLNLHFPILNTDNGPFLTWVEMGSSNRVGTERIQAFIVSCHVCVYA